MMSKIYYQVHVRIRIGEGWGDFVPFGDRYATQADAEAFFRVVQHKGKDGYIAEVREIGGI